MHSLHQHRLLGRSPAIRAVVRLLDRAAPSEAGLLITGEPGSGKALAARALHERSRRRAARFVVLDCAARPAAALEAELFGRSAGTGLDDPPALPGLLALADGGTLHLAEVCALPGELQLRLLHVLETRRDRAAGGLAERAVDVRVVASTTRSVAQAVRDGALREDLLYRLAVLTVAMPTLRERGPEEVRLLAGHFLDRLNRSQGTQKRLGAAALAMLRQHHWPGNVRELRNAIERAFILGDRELQLQPLPLPVEPVATCLRVPIGSRLDVVERLLIEATLGHHGGNKRRAAAVLGCSVKTLYNKLACYDRRQDGGRSA